MAASLPPSLPPADVFKADPDYQENEEKYKLIRAEILGEGVGSGSSDSEEGSEEDSEEEEEEESDEGERGVVSVIVRTQLITVCSRGGEEDGYIRHDW